jgi:hypothetical protein
MGASLVAVAVAAAAAAGPPATLPDLLAPVLQSIAAAEAQLQQGELESAESQYRDALMLGWQLVGALATIDGGSGGARAFAGSVGGQNRRCCGRWCWCSCRCGPPRPSRSSRGWSPRTEGRADPPVLAPGSWEQAAAGQA